MYIYMYVCIYIDMCVCIYIYIVFAVAENRSCSKYRIFDRTARLCQSKSPLFNSHQLPTRTGEPSALLSSEVLPPFGGDGGNGSRDLGNLWELPKGKVIGIDIDVEPQMIYKC